MLRDSAHIQVSDAEWKTRKAQRAGGPPVEPVYDLEDAEGALGLLRPCRYGERLPVLEGVEIRFTDVGHLLGSAAIELWLREGDTERKVVFSGDVGNTNQPLLRDPQRVESADVLIIESTYGDRLHEKVRPSTTPAPSPKCCSARSTAAATSSSPLSPSAARRRCSTFCARSSWKTSSMATAISPSMSTAPSPTRPRRLFLQADPASLDDEARALIRAGVNPLWFDGLKTSVTAEESKAINFDKTPKVILSASGMCDAGRIRHHLKHNLWRKESTILFVGYQAEGTLGRQIVEGAKKVKLFGEDISVAAEVRVLPGVSGHADRDGLLTWLEGFAEKPGRVFVNHGDDASCTSFVETLKRLGHNASAPFSGATYDIARRRSPRLAGGRAGAKGQGPRQEQRLCPPARRHRAPHARRPRLRGHGQQGTCQVRQPGGPPRRRVGAVGESAPARGFQRSDIPPTFPTGKAPPHGALFLTIFGKTM